jgi:hypothetical protein
MGEYDLCKNANSFTKLNNLVTMLSEYSLLQPMNSGQPRHNLGMEGTQYATCSQPSDGLHQQQKQKNHVPPSIHDSHLRRMQHYEPNHLWIDHINL